MRWKPEGSVAIVTGASSGIGRCLCQLLISRGANVVAVARRGDRVDELIQGQQLGRLIPIGGDITDSAVRRLSLIHI